MPRDTQHTDPLGIDPLEASCETTRFSHSVEAVRNRRRLWRALARAREAIREAHARGEAPRPALLARVEAIQQELAVMNSELAVRRGKTPRESVTRGPIMAKNNT